MPGNNMLERTSTVGYVRPMADRDDVTSVISQAKTMLSDGRLNASANAYNLQSSMAFNQATSGLTAEQLSLRPTSSYLCSHCKV